MARENRPQRKQDQDDGFIKKLIGINRVSKTVKGGRNMRFAAHAARLQRADRGIRRKSPLSI